MFVPVDSLGPAQLAVEALDDGFIAPVLNLETKIQFDEFSSGIKQELFIMILKSLFTVFYFNIRCVSVCHLVLHFCKMQI